MLKSLHPNLKAYTDCLLTHKFGVQELNAEVNVRSYGDEDINKLTVSVQYCHEVLTWDFIFNLDDLYCPPDIVAMDTAIEALPIDDIKKHIPTLSNWCPTDESCLLNLVLDLVNLHRFSQVQLLKDDDELNRQLFEYESLTTMGNIPVEKLEILVLNMARGPTCVIFHMPLQLDLSDLPFRPPDGPTGFLTVTYRIAGNTHVELKMDSEVKKLIGTIQLPPLLADSVLTEYILNVEHNIETKINEVRMGYQKKKRLFAAIASRLGTSILNGDSDDFSKISFLITRGNRNHLWQIEIPTDFPNGQVTAKVDDAQRVLKIHNSDRSPEQIALDILRQVVNFKLR